MFISTAVVFGEVYNLYPYSANKQSVLPPNLRHLLASAVPVFDKQALPSKKYPVLHSPLKKVLSSLRYTLLKLLCGPLTVTQAVPLKKLLKAQHLLLSGLDL